MIGLSPPQGVIATALAPGATGQDLTLQSATPTLALRDTTSGQSTPNKFVRSSSGQFQVLNSAGTAAILVLGDGGDLGVSGHAALGTILTIGGYSTTDPSGATLPQWGLVGQITMTDATEATAWIVCNGIGSDSPYEAFRLFWAVHQQTMGGTPFVHLRLYDATNMPLANVVAIITTNTTSELVVQLYLSPSANSYNRLVYTPLTVVTDGASSAVWYTNQPLSSTLPSGTQIVAAPGIANPSLVGPLVSSLTAGSGITVSNPSGVGAATVSVNTGAALAWSPSQTFGGGLQVGGSSGTDPFLLAPDGLTANADRPYGALAQQYSGIGIQGHTDAGADSNPIFSVWTNDGTQYFTVNNGGKVATYHTVLDDGNGNLLPDKNVTINSGQVVTIGYNSGAAQGSALLFGNATGTASNTQIGTGGGSVAGITGSIFGIAQAGVAWLLGLDAHGNLGLNGGLATGFNGGNGVAVGTLPSGMAAMFAGNAPSGYTDWLLQLMLDGTTAFHVDNAGNAVAQGGVSAGGVSVNQTILIAVPPNGSGGYKWSGTSVNRNYSLLVNQQFGGSGTMYLTGGNYDSTTGGIWYLYQSNSSNLNCWGAVCQS